MIWPYSLIQKSIVTSFSLLHRVTRLVQLNVKGVHIIPLDGDNEKNPHKRCQKLVVYTVVASDS